MNKKYQAELRSLVANQVEMQIQLQSLLRIYMQLRDCLHDMEERIARLSQANRSSRSKAPAHAPSQTVRRKRVIHPRR